MCLGGERLTGNYPISVEKLIYAAIFFNIRLFLRNKLCGKIELKNVSTFFLEDFCLNVVLK